MSCHEHRRGWCAVSALLATLLAVTASPARGAQSPSSAPGAGSAVSVCPVDTHSRGWCGDGGPARSAHLNDPHQIAPLASGGFLVADTGNNVIRKVDADGDISTVAGTPLEAGYSGDGGAATAAKLSGPMGVADLGGGAYAIADTGNGVVRVVDATGHISTRGASGSFSEPRTVTATAGGGLLVADAALQRIFSLSAAGVRSVVAGTGAAGAGGDGGLATQARLTRPTSVAVDPSSHILLIADSGNRAVRRVTPDGMIATVAGGSPNPLSGPPLGAQPTAVGFDLDAGQLIGAGPNVERLGADGVLRRIAGTGRSGFDLDAGAATATTMGQVSAVVAGPDGSILIADADDDRVRELRSDGTLLTVAGTNAPLPPPVVAATGGSAPVLGLVSVYSNQGNCPRKRASRSFTVSFFAFGTMKARAGKVKVKVRLTDNATVKVTITRRGKPKRTIKRKGKTNVHLLSLGRLKPAKYTLHAQAYKGSGTRRVFSCATGSLHVT
jgi:hypothetical protein